MGRGLGEVARVGQDGRGLQGGRPVTIARVQGVDRHLGAGYSQELSEAQGKILGSHLA